MAEPIPQLVTIKVVNGQVVISPLIRDLYLGEEVEWVCTEDDWEVAFVEDRTAGAASPFISDTFGPGLTEATSKTPRQSQTRLLTDELPKYLTGVTTEDAEDGRDFKYEARVRSFSPRTARVRIFRRVRPH